MKVILTGATGVLGSHIMYEILESFVQNGIDGTLYLISRAKGKVSAKERISKLLSSSYTPKNLKEIGLETLHQYIQLIDVDLSEVPEAYSNIIQGAYFIHSAGFVNLSTDEEQRDKIFEENTAFTKTIFETFSPFITKFIYISTAFSSGERSGIIGNDFHNLDFEPRFRNAYENAKFESEKFVIEQSNSLGLPFQILRPSVIGGKMMGTENNYFIPKFMVFYLLAKFFHFTANKSSKQLNVRFIVNSATGLNIIPVDYVAKIIFNTFQREDIQQLNIVNRTSFNIVSGLELIMNEVGYSNFSTVSDTFDFDYQNSIEKIYYESIGKHLKPYFITDANEYDTSMLQSILPIPNVDATALTNMIHYARMHKFKDIKV
ncbi:SDR family oxidoreductase [Flavobacterium nackdongense]|uniref:NAD-dependent epimerase/dehydratase family protein n=1 Tax=Flavobacterium nackdongense TaxID=2547394 RepID=A0A4V1AGT2_9FLAO|nr:SDR family oxidoreductase [Flavobacterium nackdongense]QBN19132.1 NAD-dependent epimerase/dehydratase family protein [Flavobacterium nackdongense]